MKESGERSLWRSLAAQPRPLVFAATMLLCLMMAGNGFRPSIVSAQQSGQNARKIWSGDSVDRGGSPSFDGRYLSYTDPGTGDLGILDLATGATRRLTTGCRRSWYVRLPCRPMALNSPTWHSMRHAPVHSRLCPRLAAAPAKSSA